MRAALIGGEVTWDDLLRTHRPYINLATVEDETRVPIHFFPEEELSYPKPDPMPEGIIIPIEDDDETISFVSSDEEDTDLGEGEILGME